MRLYDIAEEYRTALDAITVDEDTGEVFGIDALEMVSGVLDDKLTACVIKLRELDADASICKDEIARLRAVKTSIEKRREQLAAYITECMNNAQKTRIDDPRARAYLRQTERVVVEDAEALPENVCKVEMVRKPDLKAIKQAIKDGMLCSAAHIEDGTALILQKRKEEAE